MQNQKKYQLLFLITIIAFIAIVLSPVIPINSLSSEEYIQWIQTPENGLRVRKEIGGYIFTLQYKPHDYLALQSLQDLHLDRAAFHQAKAELGDLEYYTLQIAPKQGQVEFLKSNIKSPDEYYRRIEYFSFQMQNDLKLFDKEKSLPCVLHHFERNYGVVPYANFVLAFANNSSKEKPGDQTFVYEDRILGTGPVQIKLRAEDFEMIPALRI